MTNISHCDTCTCFDHEECIDCGVSIPDDRWCRLCNECRAVHDHAEMIRRRQHDYERKTIEYAERVAHGVPVCESVTTAGSPCNAKPLLGHHRCYQHATDSARTDRDYGRMLGEMSVNDTLAIELARSHPWPRIVEAYRRQAIATAVSDALTRWAIATT